MRWNWWPWCSAAHRSESIANVSVLGCYFPQSLKHGNGSPYALELFNDALELFNDALGLFNDRLGYKNTKDCSFEENKRPYK